ncbi:ubiquitin carboxyl-terminal hydrolase 14-like, partial [Octopus sinensis]
NVKWVSQVFNNITLDTDEPTIVFKAQLMTLTNVCVERQKLIIKGKLIEDDWEDIKVIDGQTIILLGQAGDVAPLNPCTVNSKSDSPAKIAPPSEEKSDFSASYLAFNKLRNRHHECLWAIPEIIEALSFNVGKLPMLPLIYKEVSLFCETKPKESNIYNQLLESNFVL